MNLDEAIKHAEEKAGGCETECQIQHNQLAVWLKDYKRLLEKEAAHKTLEERLDGYDGDYKGKEEWR